MGRVRFTDCLNFYDDNDDFDHCNDDFDNAMMILIMTRIEWGGSDSQIASISMILILTMMSFAAIFSFQKCS